jgi:8-oxo-dGTP pyrophosphatase MutT (NUDIX family)
MPYVPPHLRGGVPNSNKKQVTRLKAIAIPMAENKLVVVRDSSGDLTFPGGGCRYGSNTRVCAVKELEEETKKTIKKNVRNLRPLFMFTSKLRSEKEQLSDKNEGIDVTSEYHVFGVPVENFEQIRKNYYSQKLLSNTEKKNKKFMETIGIHLMSLNNLRSKKRVYSIVKNNILKRLNDPRFRVTQGVSSRRPNRANAGYKHAQPRSNEETRPSSSRARW